MRRSKADGGSQSRIIGSTVNTMQEIQACVMIVPVPKIIKCGVKLELGAVTNGVCSRVSTTFGKAHSTLREKSPILGENDEDHLQDLLVTATVSGAGHMAKSS